MASRDLTNAYFDRRTAALKRRTTLGSPNGNGLIDHGRGNNKSKSDRLTAGGSRDDDDGHSLMLIEEGDRSSDGIQMTNLNKQRQQPTWVVDVDQVKLILQDIRRQIKDLRSLHASRVGSVFGKDLDDMEVRIENMTRDVTDKFRRAERILRQVGAATRRAGGEEAAIGANVQRSLAKQLQELSADFRQSQRKYLAEVRAQKSGLDITGATSNDHFAGIDLSTEEGGFFTTQQVQVADDLQEAIESRDQEISKIAQSIEELGTIFKELAVLVIDQGTILDRIDYNMEAVVESTKTGVKQLERAEKSQKNARPMKCIVCLVITIFILLVILIFKHKRRW
mmetsp:Transcript_7661/g.8897  ORF Transcript_7661/g.8897 Transcript_7661/m.8897 type:complete len:338 (-) Transcript_7661:82-1095(-)|eukprot:CAMPEP_0170787592 /NCGR_PEP_ID=MMETSP0733-20121128/18381_1 /TAXON_ID=186038 /ORGANISM="Fragilariopsis kerguelensis, Strain L26-C5" /LENGTH=337 /DNA_ID=CAMNT_0011133841 /DNA_START=208 /DNA_END=1221 /DNA_ORIENTATION=-